MVIVFVIENFNSKTDGTVITANRFREQLIKNGHTVRIVSNGVEGPDMFNLRNHYVPVVTEVAAKNNVFFAHPDKKVLRTAFEGADIVHFYMPWKLAQVGRRLCEKMNIPYSAAFHVQPENISYNLGIKSFEPVVKYIYGRFRRKFYRKVENVHCPSKFMAKEMRHYKYKSKLWPISNGVSPDFRPSETPLPGLDKRPDDDVINIMMIGRLAPEKRQDLIIRAVNESKYRERIQLWFAGRGPSQGKYERLGAMLPRPPIFTFLKEAELIELIHKQDLYVHASDAESEAISCIEAFSCGKVPIISDSKRSATLQFAIDKRSLFKAGDYRDLATTIDYWLDNPEILRQQSAAYAELGKKYSLAASVENIEEMFRETISDHRAKNISKQRHIKKNFTRRASRVPNFARFCGNILYYILVVPALWLLNKIFFGLKIKNKHYLKQVSKQGAVTICNHVHNLDVSFCALATYPRKPTFVSLPSNFKMAGAGPLVNLLGAIPTPASVNETKAFFYVLGKRVRQGKIVHFYPEGHISEYDSELRDFKKGAFYLSVTSQVPIVPMKIIYRDPKGLHKLFKKKPCITIVVGEPIYPDDDLKKQSAVLDLKARAELSMQELAA